MRIDRILDAQWQERTHKDDSGEPQSKQLAPKVSRKGKCTADSPYRWIQSIRMRMSFNRNSNSATGPMSDVRRANCNSKSYCRIGGCAHRPRH